MSMVEYNQGDIVRAKAYEIPANRIMLWLCSGTIRCGKCGCTFRAKVPFIDYPTIPCTYCNTFNRLDVVVENNREDSGDYDSCGYDYDDYTP